MPRNIRVSSAKFSACLLFASKDKIRPYLNGVYIEPHKKGGVTMVATDGHTMAVVRDPDGEADAAYICSAPPALVKAALYRSRGLLDSAGTVCFKGSVGYVLAKCGAPKGEKGSWPDPAVIGPCHIAAVHAPAIDATFPDWRHLMVGLGKSKKTKAAAEFFEINPALLTRFQRAAEILRDGTEKASLGVSLTFNASNPHGPALVTIKSADFFGLVMPMRLFESAQELPEWYTP